MDTPSTIHAIDLGALEEVEGMPTTEQFDRLSERLDDIRAGQVTFAVEQAKISGKLEAVEAQLLALQRTLADVNALRDQVTTLRTQMAGLERKEFRGWVEKLVAGALGGGLVAGAQHFFK